MVYNNNNKLMNNIKSNAVCYSFNLKFQLIF